tara:strand:- start:2939 stop:3124 length:186 start_codon:yes stop_codon:yes gene_type:complete
MALKKYILTIEYNDNGDNCEYIQEEIVDDSPETTTVGTVDLEEYFSKSEITMLNHTVIGKS